MVNEVHNDIMILVYYSNIPQKPWFRRDKYLETWLIDFIIVVQYPRLPRTVGDTVGAHFRLTILELAGEVVPDHKQPPKR